MATSFEMGASTPSIRIHCNIPNTAFRRYTTATMRIAIIRNHMAVRNLAPGATCITCIHDTYNSGFKIPSSVDFAAIGAPTGTPCVCSFSGSGSTTTG